ncbi:MAG: lysophospholipase [Desulfobacterales bacterium]|nr:lysophospholipase [Desulfobacterales bacterium]
MIQQNETTGIFSGHNGLLIFYRHQKAIPERARMVIAHGLGEHSGRYAHVIERITKMGISVWAIDHRGHGKSEGNRGHIQSFDEYVFDLKQMVTIAQKDMPEEMRFFLLGHSMGGCMALFFAQTCPKMINGIIASSPGLRPAMKVPAIKGTIGKLMSSIWPKLSFDNELNSSHLSHDASVVEAYDADPLVHRKVTARWFTQFMAAMGMTFQDAQKIQIPILMQVAGDDRLVDPLASKDFFDRVSSKDKTLRLYEGFFHEIYNEVDQSRQKALNDLEHWLISRIAR